MQEELRFPATKEDAMAILEVECALRKGEEYQQVCKDHLARKSVPPVELDEQTQRKAMKQAGFLTDDEAVDSYRRITVDMTVAERKPYFFLKANDDMFRPWIKPEGKRLDMDLTKKTDDGFGTMKITDLPLDDKECYLVIAAPST